jgi:hypothetical protein
MTAHGTRVALVAAAACLLTLPASGPAASSRCAARDPTTLLKNSQLRVFEQPTRDGRRGFDVFACLKATGQGNALGSARSHDYPFLYPAMDLAGPVIGYADEGCDREFCGTTVTATDMRHLREKKECA